MSQCCQKLSAAKASENIFYVGMDLTISICTFQVEHANITKAVGFTVVKDEVTTLDVTMLEDSVGGAPFTAQCGYKLLFTMLSFYLLIVKM